MDIETIKSVLSGGSPILLLLAVIHLWKQNTALQARYEAALERAIVAITKVNEHLSKDEDV